MSFRFILVAHNLPSSFRLSVLPLMPPKTYLRVRRRRNAGTALTLRVQGIVEGDQGDGSEARPPNAGGSHSNHSQHSRKRRSAIWRRVTVDEEEHAAQQHMMEAILSEDEDDKEDYGQRTAKRRRLTLVSSRSDNDNNTPSSPNSQQQDKSKKNKKHQSLAVLHPLQRLVDDSLQAVAVGTLAPRQHYQFVCRDPRLAPASSHATNEWITWRNSSIGTLLHATALWNDVALSAEIMQRQQNSRSGNTLKPFCDVVDGQGRTAWQLARALGHEGVAEVLQSYGATTDEESDPAYVYDVYCWDGDMMEDEDVGDNEALLNDNVNEEEDEMPCLLQNGFFNDDGELLLWLADDEAANKHDYSKNFLNDEDEDSNDEDWQGNDYPEEENDNYDNPEVSPDDLMGENDDFVDELYQEAGRGRFSSSVDHLLSSDYQDEGDYDYAYGL